MSVTVAEVIGRIKTLLLETATEGVRWTNDELVGWLNEFYEALAGLRPDAVSVNAEATLVAGTKQTIPPPGYRLLDVVRNTAATSAKEAIRVIDRAQLDGSRPGWHGEDGTQDIEHFMFDEQDPKTYYVYPPALATAKVDLIYAEVPVRHDPVYNTAKTDDFKVGDQFIPSAVDYVCHRAFAKDSEAPASAQRSATHYQVFTTGLGVRSNVAKVSSPNPNRGQAQ